VSTICNSVDVITWNTDKHYLAEVAAVGLPIVPTIFIEPGQDDWVNSARYLLAMGDVVVKPAIKRCTLRPDSISIGDARSVHSRSMMALMATVKTVSQSNSFVES
jgi:hypothetical protein